MNEKLFLKNLLLESIMEEHSINEVKPKDILKKGLIPAALIGALYGGYQSIKDNPIKANTGIEKVQSMEGKAMPHREILIRQAFQESRFNPEATSPRGAKGIAQIMPSALEDYLKRTGKDPEDVNLNDIKSSIDIQLSTMQNLYNASFIEKKDREQSEVVRLAKTLAAYNYGRGNLNKVLITAKEKGLDIYNSLDWMKSLPKETYDYINKILLKKDSKFEKEYQQAIKSQENKNIIKQYKKVNSLEK
jgi:hypothetical protein